MIVQLWEADYVPSSIPNFVHPHITVDYDSQRKTKRYYIFEVDPSHEVFYEVKDKIDLAQRILVKSGFKNPKHFITTEKPDGLVETVCDCCKSPNCKCSNKNPRKPKGFGS